MGSTNELDVHWLALCLCGQGPDVRCRIAITMAVARDCAATLLQILAGCHLMTDGHGQIRRLGLKVNGL
jgi:hypothetical protein